MFQTTPIWKGISDKFKNKILFETNKKAHKQIKNPKHTQIRKTPTGNQPQNTWPVD